MSKIILIVTVLGCFFGCTKFGKNVTVTGRVVNPLTGQGFEGLEVQLQKTKNSLPGGYTSVKEVYTDSEGYFEINHLAGANSYHVMVQTTTDQYRLGWLIDGNYQQNSQLGVTKGKKMNVDYHAVPYGKLKTNVNNISCEDAADVISINLNYRINPSDQIFQPGIHYGCINISGTSSDIPMGYYDFTWTVTKTSTGTNTFTGEVFVPEGGIGEFTINY